MNLWSQKGLLLRAVLVDLRTQYAGTLLGMLWVVMGPIFLLTLYGIIYTFIFNVRAPSFSREEYILNVFSGLVPFLAFAQALSASAGAMLKDIKLLYSAFPAEFIPMKSVLTSYVILVPATCIVIIGDIIFSKPSMSLLLLPLIVILQLMFSLGLGFYLALLTIVLRDINKLIQYVVIALLVVTPIAYTPDMIPEKLKLLLYVNPLFYYVSANQHLILLNQVPPVDILVPAAVLAFFFFFSGLWVFSRARLVLADLL